MNATTMGVDQGNELHAVYGRPIQELTAAEIGAGIPKLEALVAGAEQRVSGLEQRVKAEAVDALGSQEGMARLVAMRGELAPLQAEREVLRWSLEAAREAHEAKRQSEWQQGIATARAELEKGLRRRYQASVEIDELIELLTAKIHAMHTLGVGALNGARSKLSAANAVGFRLSGQLGEALRLSTLQREINMALCSVGGVIDLGGGSKELLWRYDQMPVTRAVPKFSQMTSNWHADLLRQFDERYERDHPAPASEHPAVRTGDAE